MASLRYLRSMAIGLSLLSLAAPRVASADCPDGSGIEFPFLTKDEFECQRHSFLATLDYFYAFVDARQDCFSKELKGQIRAGTVHCLEPITNELPGTTGDEDTDRRLRVAESKLVSRVLNHCTNVSLATIGFPGFCDDATPETPYNAFDHTLCLLDRSKKYGTFILDTEHPPFPPDLRENEAACEENIARLSSRMTTTEFDHRGHCLLRQVAGDISLPPGIDCRRELDPQDPDTGRPPTDEFVVEAHNHILVFLPNSCPAINLNNLGFPHRCTNQIDGSIFPLPALTECMFDFHHQDIFRYLDVVFPCSSRCGNFFLNVGEECDDSNNTWVRGDFCRRDCTRVLCGDTDDDGDRDIVDALYVLRAAVGLESCTLHVCDVTGDFKVRASDALRLLQFSVGLPVLLNCPDVSVTCGNGFLEAKETCDDGDSQYVNGEYCNSACLLVDCGDTDDSGHVSIVDAHFILQAAVGNRTCDKSVCDVSGNGSINSTDALRAEMFSVGLPVFFNCPPPPVTPPAPPIE